MLVFLIGLHRANKFQWRVFPNNTRASAIFENLVSTAAMATLGSWYHLKSAKQHGAGRSGGGRDSCPCDHEVAVIRNVETHAVGGAVFIRHFSSMPRIAAAEVSAVLDIQHGVFSVCGIKTPECQREVAGVVGDNRQLANGVLILVRCSQYPRQTIAYAVAIGVVLKGSTF